jgi:hypothetical protein
MGDGDNLSAQGLSSWRSADFLEFGGAVWTFCTSVGTSLNLSLEG